MERRIVTVFGGSGFIGRYVVRRLAAAEWIVRVAVRDPESAAVPEGGGRPRAGGAVGRRHYRRTRR